MDEFLKQTLNAGAAQLVSFSYKEFLIAILLSFVLSLAMTFVYRWTHSGLSYSRSFAMTMVLMSMTIAFIMLIIGSNLARAFALVGALSIIRFRNAVKASRDVAFIFLTMAIGMACGVRLFGMALMFTVLSSIILFIFDRMNFGASHQGERIVQFSTMDKINFDQLESRMKNMTKGKYYLLSSENLDGNNVATYCVELGKDKVNGSLLSELQGGDKNLDVRVLTGFEKFNV